MRPRLLYSLPALWLLAAPASAAVSGTVVTPDELPVEGARVEVVEGDAATVTDRRGGFTVPEVEAPVLLLIRHPRFEDRAVQVEEGRTGPVAVVLQPRQEVYEEIVVSATRSPGGGFQPVSVAASAVTPEEKPAPPSTVMEVIEGVPGVAESGQGGHFQTFSIRGIAGQRVLTLVSGARVVSERRAGVSLSFLDPLLLGTVEVVRGPSSSYYGSGALGGVVQVFPRQFGRFHLDTGYATAGDERHVVVGGGTDGWNLSAAYRAADDAATPDGQRLFSRYEQFSGVVEKRWTSDGGTTYEVVAIPSAGRDIGKPNTEFPERTTIYPEEDHLIVRAGARKPGAFRYDLWAHPNRLETRVTEGGGLSRVENEAFDLGANAQWELALPWEIAGRVGLELFGRRGVRAVEEIFGADRELRERSSTLDASEDQAAAYGSLRRAFGTVTVEAGGRFSWIEQDNEGFADRDDQALSGFVGATVPFADGFELAANVGTGLRFPTLSERFFTGTTGRGEVISNTDLDPERSVSGDLGLRYFGERVFASAYLFRNEIDDSIERIDVEPGVRTFVNLTSGTIEGVELDGFFQATDDLRLGWRGQWIDGEDDTGAPLAAIAADRIAAEATWEPGPWTVEGRVQHRFEKDDPGSGEKAIPSAELLSASVTYNLRYGFSLTLAGDNLLDETYFPSADRRSVHAPERSAALTLRWTD